jgi:hypothetical protein
MSNQQDNAERMAQLEAELAEMRASARQAESANREREAAEARQREAAENTFYGQPLPNDEAGWQYTMLLVQERAANNEAMAPQVQELKQRYAMWQRRNQEREVTSVRNRADFERRLDRAIPDEKDPARRVALAAFDNGMSVEELEADFLNPYSERIRETANSNATEQTRESLAGGSAIEGGERSVNDGGEPSGDKPKTASEQVSENVANLFQKRGPSYGKIFG